MAQHRTVLLAQDVLANLDDKIRANAEDVPVEGGMVKLAKGKTIWNGPLSERMPVRQDVRGVQELQMPKATNRAVPPLPGLCKPKVRL